MPAPQRTGGPRAATTTATSGSQTITASSSDEQGTASRYIHTLPSETLRLRAETSSTALTPEAERRVQWAEGVVNNEGMGKKSSKVCCIYHKPRPIDESSDENSSDSSSEDDSDNDDGAAKASGKGKIKDTPEDHGDRQHDDGCRHHHGKGKQPKRTPNAYEQIPKNG